MKTAQILPDDDRPGDEWYVLVAAAEVSIPANRARNFRIALDQNVVLRIDGGTSGADVILRVENAGSFTLTPNPSMVFRNGETTIPLVASGVTVVRFQYDDGAFVWEVVTPLSRSRADGLYATLGSGAPTDADYLVKTANASLSAERAVTDTATITWDWSAGALAKANLVVPITVAQGGTNATTAAGARTNLNLPYNLDSQTTIVTSLADTNENTLMTFAVLAAQMPTRGDVISGRMVFFTNAAAPATRRIRIYFGATAIYDSGGLVGFTSTTLVVDYEIQRVTATTQKASAVAFGDFTVISSVPQRTAPGETLANSITLKATSQQGVGAGAADVTQASMTTNFLPVYA